MSILNTVLSVKGNQILSAPSKYKPSEAEKERTSDIIAAFTVGDTIRNTAYREFNDMSLIERQSRDQKSFNSWQEPESRDPDEAWKSNAVRPIARNKIISIAAHVTGALIAPKIFAQNENDEADKDAAQVMKDLMLYRNEQAGYERTFLYSVISALVNPAVIVHTEFSKVMRRIKEITSQDNWTEKEVLDEVLSGFRDSIVPVDELYIGNVYESNIQKQPFLIWRRVIDYEIAESKYKNSKNFQYVRPGVQNIYDDGSDTFYEQDDNNMNDRQVEEVIYYNRTEDLQIPMVNGIIQSHPDQPIKRKDKNYPFAKTGYELIDEGNFVYYRSLANKMSVDEEVVNTLYRMVIDGTFLQLMPPMAVFGDEDVDSSVVRPGVVTPFDTESKIQKIDAGNDISTGMRTLEMVERSISESSQDVQQSGQSAKGTQTAFEISRLEQNARTMLGLFGKMISFLVKDLGELYISDIIQHLTVADTLAITGGGSRLKFMSFMIPDEKGEKQVRFDMDMEDNPTEEQSMDDSFKIMEREGGLQQNRTIFMVNPKVFRERKFRIKVAADIYTPPSENVKKALNLEAYDRAIRNPLANQESIYKDLLLGSYDTTKDNPDKYITKPNAQQQHPGIGQHLGYALSADIRMAEQAGVGAE